jgi:hypothetical protein
LNSGAPSSKDEAQLLAVSVEARLIVPIDRP